MSLKSKLDLRDAALEFIQIKDADSEVLPSDSALVLDAIQAIYERLIDENLMIFDPQAENNAEVIPARIFHALRGLVVLEIWPSYGTRLPEAEHQAAEQRYMRQLRRGVSPAGGDVPTPATYY